MKSQKLQPMNTLTEFLTELVKVPVMWEVSTFGIRLAEPQSEFHKVLDLNCPLDVLSCVHYGHGEYTTLPMPAVLTMFIASLADSREYRCRFRILADQLLAACGLECGL